MDLLQIILECENVNTEIWYNKDSTVDIYVNMIGDCGYEHSEDEDYPF